MSQEPIAAATPALTAVVVDGETVRDDSHRPVTASAPPAAAAAASGHEDQMRFDCVGGDDDDDDDCAYDPDPDTGADGHEASSGPRPGHAACATSLGEDGADAGGRSGAVVDAAPEVTTTTMPTSNATTTECIVDAGSDKETTLGFRKVVPPPPPSHDGGQRPLDRRPTANSNSNSNINNSTAAATTTISMRDMPRECLRFFVDLSVILQEGDASGAQDQACDRGAAMTMMDTRFGWKDAAVRKEWLRRLVNAGFVAFRRSTREGAGNGPNRLTLTQRGIAAAVSPRDGTGGAASAVASTTTTMKPHVAGGDRQRGGEDPATADLTDAQRRFLNDIRSAMASDSAIQGWSNALFVMRHLSNRYGWGDPLVRERHLRFLLDRRLLFVTGDDCQRLTFQAHRAMPSLKVSAAQLASTTRSAIPRARSISPAADRRRLRDDDVDYEAEGDRRRRDRDVDVDYRSGNAQQQQQQQRFNASERPVEVIRYVTVARQSPVGPDRSPISFPPPLMFDNGIPIMRPQQLLFMLPPPFILLRH